MDVSASGRYSAELCTGIMMLTSGRVLQLTAPEKVRSRVEFVVNVSCLRHEKHTFKIPASRRSWAAVPCQCDFAQTLAAAPQKLGFCATWELTLVFPCWKAKVIPSE